eukprot:scaffold220459_cov19-Tisochrysis_lutea.AAC.1
MQAGSACVSFARNPCFCTSRIKLMKPLHDKKRNMSTKTMNTLLNSHARTCLASLLSERCPSTQ